MRRRIRPLGEYESTNPLEGVANFFDLGVVFALGFMISLIMSLKVSGHLGQTEAALIKKPGNQPMEIVLKKGTQIVRYQAMGAQIGGEGTRIGTAYRLKTGEIVYVPEK